MNAYISSASLLHQGGSIVFLSSSAFEQAKMLSRSYRGECIPSFYSCSSRRHMPDLVPLILKHEQACIKHEIADRHEAVIFDGTAGFTV